MLSNLENLVDSNIQSTSLNQFPFPYVYIENFLPNFFYSTLQSSIPDLRYFKVLGSKSDDSMQRIKQGRNVCVVYNSAFKFSNIQQIPNKQYLIQVYSWFRTFVKPLLAQKLNVNLKQPHIESFRFVCDTTGYEKKPHTDIPQKIMSVLLYMSDCDQGTSILIPKEDGFKDQEGLDHSYDMFNTYFVTKFKPNNLLAFARTDNSFHCVRPHISSQARVAIHYDIRYPDKR